MEFFAIADARMDQTTIRNLIKLETLPEFCDAFESVDRPAEGAADVYSVWGRFRVHCLPISGGVRFSMTDCPNGLTWSITTGFPPAPERVIVHAAINRTEHDPEFVNSLVEFVNAWKEGLEGLDGRNRNKPQATKKLTPLNLPGGMKLFAPDRRADKNYCKSARGGD